MENMKFRMWDKSAGKYFTDPNIVLDCMRQQVTGIYDHEADGSVFEQFTGFRDSNCVEVFVGDVFEDEEEGDEIAVVFKDGSFCLEFTGTVGSLMEYGYDEMEGGRGVYECQPMSEYCIDTMRVVGNVHEEVKP